MPQGDAWRKRVADWKKVLDEPKNLGLKAGGTGVSDSLRQVGGDEDLLELYKKNKPKEVPGQYKELDKALANLIKVCNDNIKKHGKLFTTACAHLKEIVKVAEKRKSDAAREASQHGKAAVAD